MLTMSHNPERNTNEDDESTTTQNFQIHSLIGEMRRMMRVELEHKRKCFNQAENMRAGQPQLVPEACRRERAPVR